MPAAELEERGELTLLKSLGLSSVEGAAIMIIVAHPDDETLGIGGHLDQLDDVVIVHVTDGAPRNMSDARRLGFETREAYALARRDELVAAMAEAAVSSEALLCLGVPDQDAAAQLVGLCSAIAELLRRHEPAIVFTHAYEGGHPDHDAIAFATHMAVRMTRTCGAPSAIIVEMPLYRGEQGRMAAQSFAPGSDIPAVSLTLSPGAQRRKRRMFECFHTQQAVLTRFPIGVEQFRRAPDYDFTRLPNVGELYYERFSWECDGPRWLGFVRAALVELGLPR